jgi:phosphatidylglycerophosphatase A
MRSIKESSDELNPPVSATGALITRTSSKRSTDDYLALALSTWGVGYIPLAPGTFGSAVGVGIYLLHREAYDRLYAFAATHGWNVQSLESFRVALMLVLVGVLALAGTWAASRAERLLRRKDPGVVVVDEVVGQLITFLFVPVNASFWVIVVGFLAFRLFDIWKPYPARRLEALESGLGIMADDVVAGAYAAILVSVLVAARSFF